MRVLFWMLLIINLGLFAVMEWGGDWLNDGSAATPQPTLNEAKISIVKEPVRTGSSTTTPVEPASAPVVSDNGKSAAVCMEWSDFSGADLQRANAALAGLQLGGRLSQRSVEYNIGYWVYIPPLKDKASINQKLVQLKTRGIEEYFVVQEEGEWKHAISLGVFKSGDAAQKFLESLQSRDIHSAKIGERASKLKATVFMFNGLDTQLTDKLTALQKDFPGSELKKVECAH